MSIGVRRVCRDARFVRPFHSNVCIYTWFCEWTHGPCVPTCIRATRSINHFIHQSGRDGYVGTHGSCVRSIQNVCIYTWFFGRTHGPCVPTCIRAARPPLHFTHQSGLCGYVGTHGSCVRSMRDNQLVHPFTYQLSIKLIINDLHLAFQSHPFRRAISAILLPNMAHFTAQYG